MVGERCCRRLGQWWVLSYIDNTPSAAPPQWRPCVHCSRCGDAVCGVACLPSGWLIYPPLAALVGPPLLVLEQTECLQGLARRHRAGA